MKSLLLSALLLAASPVASFVALAANEEDQRCADLVKECFVYSRIERDDCFNGVAGHPFCVDSRVGKLAEKRLSLSPNALDASDGGPAFLGPQLIDSECLVNFDSAWSSALVKGDLSEEEYNQLSSNLDQCARIPASEVMRP